MKKVNQSIRHIVFYKERDAIRITEDSKILPISTTLKKINKVKYLKKHHKAKARHKKCNQMQTKN